MDLALQSTIINKEEEYKVEEVRKHRKWEQGTQYLVHWKDYGNKYNQWITEKRGNWRLLDEDFKSKPIKREGKSHFDSLEQHPIL